MPHFSFIPDHLVIGCASGLVVAIHQDYMAFQTWKTWDEAIHYDWGTASFRWLKGAIVGLVSGGVSGSFVS